MKLLENKIALITGASRGIGKGIVKSFVDQGCSVAFTYNSNKKAAENVLKEFNSDVKIKCYKSDASDFKSAQKLVEKVVEEFGDIDVLVNNAGITKDNLLLRMGEDDFNHVIKVNLNSVFNMTKAVQRPLLKKRSGSIIHMSSVVGVKGNAGQANYAASKAAIIGFSKSIALELGSRNIRSNVIAPGFIETEMTSKLPEDVVQGWREAIPLKRGGLPKDVANSCVFLASDLSNYITGQVLHVDGGMLT